ncbi:scavenger receptor cysteine-rich domain-containing group B protein-like [Salarias fasciatus]|uniref:scavenger receptor cysteine-rich domain-containing group B protein-like n=1 Tax=Salarias fasciatus TaxID=181472 RepID=UPI0011765ECE|nr:scavenger receptor cysteine-rich domain-containing group B protein-like [Salarias fasciatus]
MPMWCVDSWAVEGPDQFFLVQSLDLAEDPSGVEGEVHLANGGNNCSGRVEIFHDGQWGTVCDDFWDLPDAEVVCRQLGCGRARSVFPGAAFGPGGGPIWLDDVSCSGNESSISHCRHPGFGVDNCDHYEDASVICEGVEGEVHLANGGNNCSGRVEIFHDGQWGTVCDDHWDLDNADVVCRQLGCGRARSVFPGAVFGPGGGPIWLDDVSCSGNEPSISDCRHSGFGVHNCGHHEDASAICEDLLTPYTSTRTQSGQQHRLLPPRTWLKTIGDRAFEAAAPCLWNTLPDHLRAPQMPSYSYIEREKGQPRSGTLVAVLSGRVKGMIAQKMKTCSSVMVLVTSD